MAAGAPRGTEPRKPGGRRKPIPGEEHLTTRPGSPVWHFDFTIDGHRLRGSCGTGEFALAAAFAHAEHDREWRRIRLGEKPAVHLTLDEAFARWWLDRGKGTAYGEAGQRHQLARIIRILGKGTLLADLDNATVARLVRGLREGEGASEGQGSRSAASPATVNRYLATLSVVCRWAREVEGAEVGPWTKSAHALPEPEGVERFLEMDEAQRVMAEIVPHARAPIALALLTGARRNNWLALRWEEVSLDLGRAMVVGKGGRKLMLVLPPLAVDLLLRLQPDEEKRRSGPVFTYGLESVGCRCPHCASPLYRREPITSIRRSFKTAARAAGVPALRIHDLRHTHASWLLTTTGNLKLVQEQLHHRNIETTMRYAKLLAGERERGVRQAMEGFAAPALTTPKKETDAA